MKNFVQRGDTLTIPAPSAVVSGAVVILGSIIGVAAGDAESGSDVDIDVTGVFDFPKVSALGIAIGDTVYWDATNKLITKTSSGNTKMGYAVSAAGNPSAGVSVRLVPVI